MASASFPLEDSNLPRSVRPGEFLQAPEQHAWLCRLFLTIWFGVLFFHGLGSSQLIKTEGLRAIIGREFLRSGNWIVPTLYGEALLTKPPGMYAAIAACSWLGGEVTEWSARLPSALAATITVMMIGAYFSRVCGRRIGLLAMVIIPMSPIWLDKATAAEIDMMQVMWVTGSILCLLRALEKVDRENSTRALAGQGWWIGALLCVAGGFLTKWTAPAYFYATAFPLLAWRGRMALLLSRAHLLAVALGAGLCACWVVAAGTSAGWDVFSGTVICEAMQRVSPQWVQKTDPWWFSVLHPLRIWYINLPWSLVALAACRRGFGRLLDDRQKLLWQTLHCWIWPNLLIWSLMLDHKPRHSFPMFPAIGGLAVLVFAMAIDGKLAWRLPVKPLRLVQVSLVIWLVAKLLFVNVVPHLPSRQMERDPRGKAAVIASLVPTDAILYLFMIKDEGIMFYYGREVLRLAGPAHLPASDIPAYCILVKEEWEQWERHSPRRAAALTSGLRDEQGAEVVLVRVDPSNVR